MRGIFAVSVLCAVVVCAYGTSIQVPENVESENTFEMVPETHGNRMKRSPLDPIVAPLLIGKSFLYGALIGPKLFHRPRYYYHHKPHYHHHGHHGHGYAWGWGW